MKVIIEISIFFGLLLSTFKFSECSIRTSHPDFIIVGAGTAGSVLAGRLCKSLPKSQILLIEKSHPRNSTEELLIRAPRYAQLNWRPSTIMDDVESTPNSALNNRTVRFLAGNTLGGSSAVNGMMWTVPPISSVSKWNIKGLKSLSTIRRLYRKAYDKLRVSSPRKELQQMYSLNLSRAASRASFKYVSKKNFPFGYQGQHENTIWMSDLTSSWNGRRVDSFTAYAKNAIEKDGCSRNLKVIQNKQVLKLLFRRTKEKKLIVTGVQLKDVITGKISEVFAKTEVILSAGPLGTPKILQLSGIGSKPVLKKAGVIVRRDLPVGLQVQLRPVFIVSSSYEDSMNIQLERSNNETLFMSPSEILKWSRRIPSVPGIGISSNIGRVGNSAYFSSTFNFNPGSGLGQKKITSVCFSNPESFGSLLITSSNVNDKLKLDLNLFDNAEDMDRILKCIRKVRGIHAMMKSEGFPDSDIVSELTGDSIKNPIDERSLKDLVARNSIVAFHKVGACAVGSVVTSDLRVKGVKGLRVIDSTVMQKMPISAGPMASTYMIAELAAEKLTQKYGKVYSNVRPKTITTKKNNKWC